MSRRQATLVALLSFLVASVSGFAGAGTARAASRSVCIDPGHGGTDPGAVYNNVQEKDLNLDVALRLRDLLRGNGYRVALTRTTDVALSHDARSTFCNKRRADVLVSVHHNGSRDPSIDYSVSLYKDPQDLALASSVVAAVSRSLGTTNNGTMPYSSGVLGQAPMPASIIEGFFVTSDYEQQLLVADYSGRLQTEAQGLYDGISGYFASR